MIEIYEKIKNGQRISFEEGLRFYKEADPLRLAELAMVVRYRKHPERIVTFILDTNINYTNICSVGCSFCAFYKPPGNKNAYAMSLDELERKVEEAEKAGITTVLIQGGLNPDLPYSYYLEMMERLTKRSVHIHAFSPPEIDLMAKITRKSVKEVFKDLKRAGMRTMPGGGAEILTERVRKRISPAKISSDRWLEIMKEAHVQGIKTTATMMFGHIETKRDIVEHLERIRALQDETKGFTAFIAWDFKKDNNRLGKVVDRETTALDYLRLIAFARIYLDNFDNIQASWASQGEDIGEIALHFGANDMGSMLIEENVMREAGFRSISTVDRIASLIKKAGFKPALRNTTYEIVRYL